MDLMLALSEDAIHDVMWTDDLLDEWERVIVRERQRSPDAAAAITATIREFFADTPAFRQKVIEAWWLR